MVDGRGVVRLVDGDGAVDDVRGDGLLVDDGLDVLVDVVVDVLAGDGGGRLGRVRGLVGDGGVLVVGGVLVQLCAQLGLVAVLVLGVLDGVDDVGGLLGPALILALRTGPL